MNKSLLGFWVYILSDCVLFAALFATFAVLRGATASGPESSDLLRLPFVLLETLVLLTSSFTMGLAVLFANKNQGRRSIYLALLATLMLGLIFVGLEISEFRNLIAEGYGPARSAFLSSFFALVGTHGLHVSIGMLAIAMLMLNPVRHRLMCLALFWHFLDIVWIFIFTFVYLLP